MADDSALVGNCDDDVSLFFQLALAGQPAVVARVARPVYVIFLAVAHLRQQVFALLNIYVAGTAAANPAAIVVELDLVVECHFEYALTGCYLKLLLGLVFLLKSESNLTHRNWSAKIQRPYGNVRKESKVQYQSLFFLSLPAFRLENTNFAHLLICN